MLCTTLLLSIKDSKRVGWVAAGKHDGFCLRKVRAPPGKLPGKTTGHDYALEYGTDRIEIHDDAITSGERVLIIDDLLATGGTAEAAVTLVQKMGGSIVECAFLVDLPDIGGRQRLEKMGLPVFALCEFEGD